jgi:signal transduction histidine kinase
MVIRGQAKPVDSARWLERLCKGAAVGLLVADAEGSVEFCNEAASNLLGLSLKSIVGQPLAVIVSAPPLAEGTLSKGQSFDYEFETEGADGGRRSTAVTLWNQPAADGEAGSMCACLIDFTSRMQRGQQVAQVRKMHALATMAGNLSHHFNNILGSVVTRVDFARTSNDIRVLKRSFDSTAEALQRATHLLDGLLAFAEADYRDGDLSDLTETLIGFMEGASAKFAEARVELKLNLDEIPVIEVPRNHFFKVLENITNNAVEAMPEGGTLTVDLTAQGDRVTLRLTDTGAGINLAHLDRVFEPFFTTKTADTVIRESSHAGLGLSVALGVIHEMGGEMTIDSSRDRTVVEIHLSADPGRPIRASQRAWSSTDPT